MQKCDRCKGELKEKFTQVNVTKSHGGPLNTVQLSAIHWKLCERCVQVIVPELDRLFTPVGERR